MDVIKEKWEEIIQKLKVEYFLSNISFETWIRPLEVYEIRGNTLYLTVNFKASIEHIQNKYLLPRKLPGQSIRLSLFPEICRASSSADIWRRLRP